MTSGLPKVGPYIEASPSVAHRLMAPRIGYAIGTRSPDGEPNVCVASNVTSISRDPQLVVIAIFKQWKTYQNLRHGSNFTISTPRVEQQDALWKVAEKYSHFPVPTDRSKITAAGVDIETQGEFGPAVMDSIGWFSCRQVQEVNLHSDHGVFVGEVVSAKFDSALMTSEGNYLRNARPWMQVVSNTFTTSTDAWRVPFLDGRE